MVEKIFFARELSSPTYLTYCTALHDAMVNDSDFAEWFDISDVRDKEEGRTGLSAFTVSVKKYGSQAAFDIQCSGSWFLVKNVVNNSGAAVSAATGNVGHNLNTEFPLYKIRTSDSLCMMFDGGTVSTMFYVIVSEMSHVDTGDKTVFFADVNGDAIKYFLSDSSAINISGTFDKHGSYENYICMPWRPNNRGYMSSDVFFYDGGKSLLAKGFWRIDGELFLAMSGTSNYLFKCEW